MTKVVIVGGEGFVGGHLARAFRAQGDPVTVLAMAALTPTQRTALTDAGATVAEGNAQDEEAILRAAEGAQVMIHAPTTFALREGLAAHNTQTLIPIENALAAAQRARVGRFVLISTELVTASTDERKYADEMLPHSEAFVSPFAEAMSLGEALVSAANGTRDVETVVLRVGLVWGAGDTETLPRWIEQTRARTLAILGDGSTLLPTTLIDNLAAVTLRAAVASAAVGRVYNVTDDERVSAKTFMTKLLLAADVRPPRRRIPFRVAYALAWMGERMGRTPARTREDVVRFGRTAQFNMAAIREDFGYDPVHLDEGMKRVASWVREVGGADAVLRRGA